MHVPAGRVGILGAEPEERHDLAARLGGFVADLDAVTVLHGDDRVAVIVDAVDEQLLSRARVMLRSCQLLCVADPGDPMALEWLSNGLADDVIFRPMGEKVEARVGAARARLANGSADAGQLSLFLHDLNNPLTAIRILAEMLIGELADGESEQDSIDVLQAADLATANVEAMSAVVALLGAPMTPTVRMDIAGVVRRAADRPCMKGIVDLRGVDTALWVDQPGWTVEAVVNAMMLNARSLVVDGASLRVIFDVEEETLWLHVDHPDVHLGPRHLKALGEDRGPMRVRSEHVRVAALGLGYARRMARLMGGDLEFVDRPAGLRVTLNLPRVDAPPR